MNVIEPAVAEDDYHIVWPQHRNDSVHNGIGVLFQPRYLRDENSIGEFQRLRKLLLKHRASGGIRARFEHGPKPVAPITMTERLQRLSHCCGMVPEIVNYLHAARFTTKLLPSGDTGETFERAVDF